MTRFVVDASVWLAALDADDRFHDPARELVGAGGRGDLELAALDLTSYEVANVAVVRWRSAEAAGRLVALVAAACTAPVVRCDTGLLREASEIAARASLTVYHAAYVAAAQRLGCPLVSGDLRDLVRAGFAVSPDAVSAP